MSFSTNSAIILRDTKKGDGSIKSKYFVIACTIVILSLISAGHTNRRTVTITSRDTDPALWTTAGEITVFTDKPPLPIETADGHDTSTSSVSETAREETETGTLYILNRNTKRIHYPHCPSVAQMKEDNKVRYTGDKDDLIADGYKPCGNCNP